MAHSGGHFGGGGWGGGGGVAERPRAIQKHVERAGQQAGLIVSGNHPSPPSSRANEKRAPRPGRPLLAGLPFSGRPGSCR
jgi:hypothetical protein